MVMAMAIRYILGGAVVHSACADDAPCPPCARPESTRRVPERLPPPRVMPEPTPTPARQTEIYLAGAAGRRPRVPVDATRLETAARRAMPNAAFAYVAGGAGAEETMRANRAAFERWRIVPRVLRDVAVRDTSVELFGRRLPAPL